MKKYILTFLLAFTLGLTFAQVKIGPKVGLNYAYFSNTEGNDFTNFDEPILAYHIGTTAEIALNERFSFITDILASVKGIKSDEISLTSNEQVIFHNIYLAIPLGVKFKMENFGLSLGVEPALLLTERVRGIDGVWRGGTFDLFNSFDGGLFGGVDITFGNLVLGTRYIYGMSNISDVNFTDENGQPIDGGRTSNRVLQFSAAYLFSI